MGSHWSAPDVQQWKADVLQKQQQYCLLLSDRTWEQYESSELELLRCKIAFACFGYPADYGTDDVDLSRGYSVEQKDRAKEICDAIVTASKSQGSVKVATVFVCGKTEHEQFEEPVFRVCREERDDKEVAVFVDTAGCEYGSWNDYLNFNVLPRCIYCFPTNGMYCYGGPDGKTLHTVDVSYGHSPASSASNKLQQVVDGASRAATGVVIPSFFTPLVPVESVAAAEVGDISSADTACGPIGPAGALVDQNQDGQATLPADADARTVWIDLFSNVLGVSDHRATADMMRGPRSGDVLDKAANIFVDALKWGNLTVGGFGVVNNFAHLIDKFEQDELSALDVYQFTVGVLFFTHGLMSFQSATNVIKETQKEILSEHQSAPPTEDHRTAFQRVLEKTQNARLTHGHARIVKDIARITHREEFFRHLSSTEHEATPGSTDQLRLSPRGLIFVNSQLTIHPRAFTQMVLENRIKVLEAAARLADQRLTEPEFLAVLKSACIEEKTVHEARRNQYRRKVAEVFEVKDLTQAKVNGKALFRDMQPFELDRVGNLLAEADNSSPKMVEASRLFAETWGCDNAAQFCTMVEFLDKFSADKTRSAHRNEPNSSTAEVQRQVLESLTHKRSENFAELNREYTKMWKSSLSALNLLSPFRFESNKAATYHFFKHDAFDDDSERVNQDAYIVLARQLFGREATKASVRLTQEGKSVKMTYIDRQRGLFGVLVRPYRILYNHAVLVATLYYDKRYHDAV